MNFWAYKRFLRPQKWKNLKIWRFGYFQPILAALDSVKGKLGAKILPQAHGPSNSDGFGPLQTLFGLKMDRILKGLLQSIFYAKMPVSQAPDGIFGVCKGPKPSELDGPITGQQAHGPGTEFWHPTYI